MPFIKLWILFVLFAVSSVANSAIERPFLWKVTNKSNTFYLFGTIHLGDPKLKTLPSSLKRVIEKSDTIYTEVAIDDTLALKSAMLMMRHDAKSLSLIISSKLYRQIDTYLKGINPQLSLSSFDTTKIWALSSIVSLIKNQLKYPNLQALDATIYKYAQEKNKSVGGIETIESQVAIMDRFSTDEQVAMLESTVNYLQKNPNAIEQMKQLYINGNEQKMLEFILSTMAQEKRYKELEDKFMEAMLYNRNITMLQKIESLVEKNPKTAYLFAFGVMHFLGDKSIISYLQCNGYSVTRVE